jgi:hypothetical protein
LTRSFIRSGAAPVLLVHEHIIGKGAADSGAVRRVGFGTAPALLFHQDVKVRIIQALKGRHVGVVAAAASQAGDEGARALCGAEDE